MSQSDDHQGYQAGRLIQWGLRPKAIPFNEPEYRELIDCYIDRPQFRTLVQGLAHGLGLIVLAVGIIGSHAFQQEQDVTLKPGLTATIGDYKLVYFGNVTNTYPDVTVIGANPAEVVAALRREPGEGDIWLFGGGQLFSSLLAGARWMQWR